MNNFSGSGAAANSTTTSPGATTTAAATTGGTTTTTNNMVPIISVTPHSPGAKYNCILGEIDTKLSACYIAHCKLFLFFLLAEDTLNQLQCIRESVVQMKNASPQSHNTIGLVSLLSIIAVFKTNDDNDVVI